MSTQQFAFSLYDITGSKPQKLGTFLTEDQAFEFAEKHFNQPYDQLFFPWAEIAEIEMEELTHSH